MLGKIIILVLITASAHANWFEQWANGLPRAGGATEWTPPGYSQSLFWWKFSETSGTNFADSSIIGTNTAYINQATAGSTNWVLSSGAFKPMKNSGGANAYVLSKRSTIGTGIGNTYTWAIWALITNQNAEINGLLTSRGSRYNIMYAQPANAIAAYCDGAGCSYVGSPVYTVNIWQRWIYVRNGTNFSGYINGVKVLTGNLTTNNFTPALWYAGTEPADPAGRILAGFIDDAYFTTYPYTATDATNDYLQGRSP
jgi:hypothetical protein